MLDFTWNIFRNTGSIETYLLYKELEKNAIETPEEGQVLSLDATIQ